MTPLFLMRRYICFIRAITILAIARFARSFQRQRDHPHYRLMHETQYDCTAPSAVKNIFRSLAMLRGRCITLLRRTCRRHVGAALHFNTHLCAAFLPRSFFFSFFFFSFSSSFLFFFPSRFSHSCGIIASRYIKKVISGLLLITSGCIGIKSIPR